MDSFLFHFPPVHLHFSFEKLRCHNAIKICMINNWIIVNTFGLGTTMVEWSLEKATMIDKSRMHIACYNFEN